MSGVEAVAWERRPIGGHGQWYPLSKEHYAKQDCDSHWARLFEYRALYSQQAIDTLRAQLEAAEAEIDWIKAQPDDDGRMFAEIEAAAKASYRRHQSSVRGQVLTRADQYESHLVWAALEWAARTKEDAA